LGQKRENRRHLEKEEFFMTKRREDIRIELLGKAEAMIDELLDWHEKIEAPNFHQLEAKIMAIRQEMSREMGQVLLEGQETTRPEEGVLCGRCAQAMRYKGAKKKTVESLLGRLTIERAYYYCPGCQKGFFPPG
jgi:hypothetical protein